MIRAARASSDKASDQIILSGELMRLTFALASTCACFAFGLPAAKSAEAVNPAHALAQKFAIDETAPAPNTRQPVAKTIAPPARRAATKPGADYENEMLEAARAEAAARESAGKSAVPPALPNPPTQAAAPVEVQAQKPPQTPPLPITSPTPSAAGKPALGISISVANPVQHAANDPAHAAPAPTGAATEAGQHVTILLVLTPSDKTTSNGKAQSNPILCAGDECYVGTGSASPAKIMARAEAMAAKNSALGLPGICQGFAYCVFRDIALKPGAGLQVIDAGFARSEPYEAFDARPDKTCVLEDGDLDCQEPVTTKDYRLWIVPEPIAQNSKPAQIEDALSTGLVEENVTRAEDK